eukprot:TRINITY_DN82179_c0_g1_i1.p1 TRINITY_DN82179_c0_g1~~TRINITY_DN82179_c0_g1_i1.p1  ORF type:complete len:121 (-),score=27.55 TRINITY_DN82179_c0_g1_i1:106-429(-)
MGVIDCATEEDFDTVLDNAGERLVVVDFFATWCVPCQAMKPKVNDLSVSLGDDVFILRVDVDVNERIADRYEVQAMPTFMFFKRKERKDSFCGGDIDKLKSKVTQHR